MIRIGITGHRILARQENIKAGIKQVIDNLLSFYPTAQWEVISALAEGADCLFVEEATHQLNAGLVVVLPLPVENYLGDFHNATNKATFNKLLDKAQKIIVIEPQTSKEKAYLAAGAYIVENCDVLVAIWDGQKAQGLGGTGDIVALARRKALPLAWIQAGNRRHGTKEPTDLEEKQGQVVFERFSHAK